jgi:radical SAM superfamily enzyme YgiQ (UPF0313 family)
MATLQRNHLEALTGSLREPGRIVLVSCYELGHQPLNLALPLTVLQDAGYRLIAVDTAVESLDDVAVTNAGFIAVSVPMHTALRLGVELAERIRRLNPSAVVCFYGLYAWLNADYLLREHGDYVIGGEYERPLLDLVDALEGGRDPSSVPGVGSRDGLAGPVVERVVFPEPDRSGLTSSPRYARLMIDGREVRAGYTEATRGCRHTCLHCPVVPVYQGRFFAIPRSVVLADVRQQVQTGAGHITFGDPDALNGPTHLLRIAREMRAEFPELTFDITTRIEHVIEHQAVIPELAELGCVFTVSAVEAVSPLILEKIDKGHTKEDVVQALDILDRAGISMRPSLLPFTPWTGLEDYLELLAFVAEYGLVEQIDPVHLSIRLLVPPGSALLDQPDSAEWLGRLDEANFTWTWDNPDPRVDELQRRVAGLVDVAEREGTCPKETFAAIWRMSHDLAGKPGLWPAETKRRNPKPPPRLSESWFC